MNMQKKKGPFAPVTLSGHRAAWFVDYLEGKTKKPKNLNRRRKEVLARADRLEREDYICLD